MIRSGSKTLLLFVFVFVLSCASKTVTDQRFVTLKIYHTNDIHSHLLPNAEGRGGIAYLASVLKIVKTQESDSSLILDAGDMFKKGSIPTRKTKEEFMAQLVSDLPYGLRAVGNNEIKVGIPRFLQYARKYEGNHFVSANFVDKDGKTVFPPYKEFQVQGLKIAVIGLTVQWPIEPENQPSPKEDSRAPYRITDWNQAVKPFYDELRAHSDIVLFLTHVGFVTDQKIAQAFPKTDAIVGGHSHTLTPEFENVDKMPVIVQAGEFGEQIGVLMLTYDKESKHVVRAQSNFWSVGEQYQLPNEEFTKKIEDAYKKYAPDAREVIGRVGEELGLINEEDNLEVGYTDWVADLLKKTARADIGLINRQALREPLRIGSLNKDQLFMAAPYDDVVAKITIDREKLRKMLIAAIRKDWNETGMVAFGFSNDIAVRLSVRGEKLESVDVRLPHKNQITVALPSYAYMHCEEIFGSQDCTEKVTRLSLSVQDMQINEFKRLGGRTLKSPELDRVDISR